MNYFQKIGAIMKKVKKFFIRRLSLQCSGYNSYISPAAYRVFGGNETIKIHEEPVLLMVRPNMNEITLGESRALRKRGLNYGIRKKRHLKKDK